MEKNRKNSKKIEKTASVRGFEQDYVPHTYFGGIDKTIFSSESGVSLNTLYEIVKTSPEVMGCLQAIVEDIMADGWKYIGSKSAIKKTEAFEINSQFYKVLANAIFDLLITGNAYILKLSVSEENLKSLAVNLTKQVIRALKPKGRLRKENVYELIKQNFTIPKDLQVLKSATVKINFDETGKIVSYEQNVHGKQRIYRPEDIIHLSLINVGGSPYGFSGLEPLLSDLGTLLFAKEFAGRYFENDGIPYFVFKMPEATPDDRNVKKLESELRELNKKENKYKSLVVTGNVDIEQVNKFNKEMEFRQLIQHFTQLVLIALGVPAHRVNLTIDVRQIGGAVNRAYEGYYKKISFIQKILENALNKNLFQAFHVTMKFNRAYKIDEMREAQIVQILTQIGAITIEEARKLMGLEPELPQGIEPKKTGDDSRVDFREDKKREEGRENEGIPALPIDN